MRLDLLVLSFDVIDLLVKFWPSDMEVQVQPTCTVAPKIEAL